MILYNLREGMDKNDPEYINCYNSVESVALDSIQNPHGITGDLNTHFRNLPLNQLCFKGSANSAYTGSYVTDIMVNYVLSRGCRFLDFEIYYLPDVNKTYNACVGYSEDPLDTKPKIYNQSNVLLVDMLQATLMHAFSGGSRYKVSNTGDPLFINLRMKTSNDNIENLYILIQDILKSTRENPQYSKYFSDTSTVNGETVIGKWMGKVVIAIESHFLLPTISTTIKKYNNMVSNSDNLNKSYYMQLDVAKYHGCPPKSHADNRVLFECKHGFNMVSPDFNVTKQHNPNVYSSIFNYGNQITLMQYYVIDQELIEHEKMFKTYNGSFVPMSHCLKYIDNYAVPEDLVQHPFPSLF